MSDAARDLKIQLAKELGKLKAGGELSAFERAAGLQGWAHRFISDTENAEKEGTSVRRLTTTLSKLLRDFGYPAITMLARQIDLAQRERVSPVEPSAAARFWEGAAHFADVELLACRMKQDSNSRSIFLVTMYIAAAGAARLVNSLGDDLRSFPNPERMFQRTRRCRQCAGHGLAQCECVPLPDDPRKEVLKEVESRIKDGRCWLIPLARGAGFESLEAIEGWCESIEDEAFINLMRLPDAWAIMGEGPFVGENLWRRCLATAEARVALQFASDVLFAFDLYKQVPGDTRYGGLARRMRPVVRLWQARAQENCVWRAEVLGLLDASTANRIYDWQQHLVSKLHNLIIGNPWDREMERFRAALKRNPSMVASGDDGQTFHRWKDIATRRRRPPPERPLGNAKDS